MEKERPKEQKKQSETIKMSLQRDQNFAISFVFIKYWSLLNTKCILFKFRSQLKIKWQ